MTAVTWSIAAQVTWWDTKKICQKIKPYKKSHDLHMTLMWLQSHDLLSHLTNTLSYQSAYIITGQCRENEKERRETEDGFEIRSERGSKRRAWRRAGREFCGVRATAPTLPPCMLRILRMPAVYLITLKFPFSVDTLTTALASFTLPLRLKLLIYYLTLFNMKDAWLSGTRRTWANHS